MKLAVSNLNFLGVDTPLLAEIPPDTGLEFFVEFGDDYLWESWGNRLLEGRAGGFSVHGPYQNLDLADPCLGERSMERSFRRAFSIARRFGARYLVLHPNAPYQGEDRMRPEAKEASFRHICMISRWAKEYGVPLCVENMGYGNPQEQLFDMKEYLEILERAQDVYSLIDVGKLHLAGWDLEMLTKALGNRVMAYHLHDNNGRDDQHLQIGAGSFDWDLFRRIYRARTPDALGVLEYLKVPLPRVLENIQMAADW